MNRPPTRTGPGRPQSPPKRGGNDRYLIPDVPGLRFPQDRRRHYTPWLVVRAAAGDDGSRPLPGGAVFWESPDVWTSGSQGINQPVPGEATSVFARVSNLGLQDATGVLVRFWWADPSLAITEATAHIIGVGSANIPSLSSAVVECPSAWVPVVENGGHECLIAEAFIPGFDPLLAPMDPAGDRHVGQKNEQLLVLAPGQPFSARLQAVNIAGLAQALTFEVHPLRAAHPLREVNPRQAARPAGRPDAPARLGGTPPALLPPPAPLPLNLQLDDRPSAFVGPSAVFARRLLTQTLQEVAGESPECLPAPQITHTAPFAPWEARALEISGRAPREAEAGQTFRFRVVQRVGDVITGGYTVQVVVGHREV